MRKYWKVLSKSPVKFGDCVSSCLPDIRRHIRSSLFDGQHHYGDDDCNSDARENSQGAGSDQLVWILQQNRARISCANISASWLTVFMWLTDVAQSKMWITRLDYKSVYSWLAPTEIISCLNLIKFWFSFASSFKTDLKLHVTFL